MIKVQQAIMDKLYNGMANKKDSLLQECSTHLFAGRGWQTANYYPGAVAAPTDATLVHTVSIDATVPATWGVPVYWSQESAQRPLGLYLSPGQVATVTVPAGMVGTGFSVLVGAQTTDNSGGIHSAKKDEHRRMDRVTVTVPITQAMTYIANPLGGGLYILVPYLAKLGVVSIEVSGGVVLAPLFQRTHFNMMTDEEWAVRRTAPGPHADFETDRFLLNVPSSWIYAFESPVEMLRQYDEAMMGVWEWLGYPPSAREGGVHTLFLQPDLHIKHGAFGIGYPQVNTIWNAYTTYNGNHNHWLIQDPTADHVCWHELGHAQLRSIYRGEEEAIVNYLVTYIRHVKFQDTFNEAFKKGRGSNYEPDDAAVHWMITPNFREGNEMDHSNTEYDEIRYQSRGWAKYADITRLFGWEAFTLFYHNENADYQMGRDRVYTDIDGLSSTDSRTLRLSKAAGVDLTPLIHFWGIHPEDESALAAQIELAGLGPSAQIRCLLQRYRELIPTSNDEFNAFFEKIWPGRPKASWLGVSGYEDPRYGLGWYNVWTDAATDSDCVAFTQLFGQPESICEGYYTESEGSAAQSQVDHLLEKYYASSLTDTCNGLITGAPEDGDVPSRPTTYSWMPPSFPAAPPVLSPPNTRPSSYAPPSSSPSPPPSASPSPPTMASKPPSPSTSPGTVLHVVLIAGQSNAEGQALAYRNDGSPGTLDQYLTNDAAAAATFGSWTKTGVDSSGAPTWPSRDDVFVSYNSEWGKIEGPLTVGMGAYGDGLHIGIELEVGRAIGDHFVAEPVLLIKVAYGGKSLQTDFRPPSAGGTVGPYYNRIVSEYQAALATVGSTFPSLAGLTAVPAGFVWWQGFNDFCCVQYSSSFEEYTSLFGYLVDDLTGALGWPSDLPVVIGETGNVEGGNTQAFWDAQRAVTALPALQGRSTFVPTSGYLYDSSLGPDSTHRHHWYGNALSYMGIGKAIGEALRDLFVPAPPSLPSAPSPLPSSPAVVSPSPPPSASPSPPKSEDCSPANAVQCAREGDTCACEGKVRYGNHGLDWESCYPCCDMFSEWVTVSGGSVTCNNAEFGDPAPGYAKYCECIATAPPSAAPLLPPPSAVPETQTCELSSELLKSRCTCRYTFASMLDQPDFQLFCE
uniref:Peptidase M60 domain-containing protein n=1 Tax=Haptolina brevifila TaxID=156173 RepID=A0A7S2BTC5_9EUKA|mmetsp:Transcript_16559/g.33305  ORF Transcript_16559/g.33305 Transcript_16559/m.33305 type:complete len:1133 (+) Transcript_16559:299-3697(+)